MSPTSLSAANVIYQAGNIGPRRGGGGTSTSDKWGRAYIFKNRSNLS